MAKGKSGGSGLRKNHGPKKKMFHAYPKCIRIQMGKLGMLRKERDKESMQQSIDSKNKR